MKKINCSLSDLRMSFDDEQNHNASLKTKKEHMKLIKKHIYNKKIWNVMLRVEYDEKTVEQPRKDIFLSQT